MFQQLRLQLSRIGRLPRLAAAVMCLLLAAVSALQPSAAAPDADTMPVVVAARTLPTGHVLTRVDLALARWPRALAPAGADARPASWVGRRLAAPITAREALTPSRLWGRDLTAGLGAGVVAVPAAIDAASARLVRAGDRVDLLAVGSVGDLELPGGTSPVARAPDTAAAGALVLAVLPKAAADEPSASVVLAVDRPTALRIASLRGSRAFTVVASAP